MKNECADAQKRVPSGTHMASARDGSQVVTTDNLALTASAGGTGGDVYVENTTFMINHLHEDIARGQAVRELTVNGVSDNLKFLTHTLGGEFEIITDTLMGSLRCDFGPYAGNSVTGHDSTGIAYSEVVFTVTKFPADILAP